MYINCVYKSFIYIHKLWNLYTYMWLSFTVWISTLLLNIKTNSWSLPMARKFRIMIFCVDVHVHTKVWWLLFILLLFMEERTMLKHMQLESIIVYTVYVEIFANFATCFCWRNFYYENFLSCINDYIEDMATFMALAKIYSTEYFCTTKVAGIGEKFVKW